MTEELLVFSHEELVIKGRVSSRKVSPRERPRGSRRDDSTRKKATVATKDCGEIEMPIALRVHLSS
jgi:hypothetical protein